MTTLSLLHRAQSRTSKFKGSSCLQSRALVYTDCWCWLTKVRDQSSILRLLESACYGKWRYSISSYTTTTGLCDTDSAGETSERSLSINQANKLKNSFSLLHFTSLYFTVLLFLFLFLFPYFMTFFSSSCCSTTMGWGGVWGSEEWALGIGHTFFILVPVKNCSSYYRPALRFEVRPNTEIPKSLMELVKSILKSIAWRYTTMLWMGTRVVAEAIDVLRSAALNECPVSQSASQPETKQEWWARLPKYVFGDSNGVHDHWRKTHGYMVLLVAISTRSE